MRKILLALTLFVSLSIHAQHGADVVGVSFGTSMVETENVLVHSFGSPNSKTDNQLVYLNKEFDGMKADRIEIGFQELRGSLKLNQARFYFVCGSKAAAVAKMKALAMKMKTKYPVSYDEEDGGVAFYKGGYSPLGIGSLFTIFVSPYKGKWSCQLRYGKFLYK